MDDIHKPLAWVNRDAKQMLAEMMGLSLCNRGIFQTVLDIICINGGACPDDDEYVMRYLKEGKGSRFKAQDWHRVRDYLIKIGYLYREGNHSLRSRFADEAYGWARRKRGKPDLKVVENPQTA